MAFKGVGSQLRWLLRYCQRSTAACVVQQSLTRLQAHFRAYASTGGRAARGAKGGHTSGDNIGSCPDSGLCSGLGGAGGSRLGTNREMTHREEQQPNKRQKSASGDAVTGGQTALLACLMQCGSVENAHKAEAPAQPAGGEGTSLFPCTWNHLAPSYTLKPS